MRKNLTNCALDCGYTISAANDWQVYLCKDPNHFIWFCETQLHYLNAVNNLSPDKKHIISGGDKLDLWCEERIQLGLRYTGALAKLGKMDEAYDAFEDMIRVIEQVMSIDDEHFELGCASPALKDFSLKSSFNENFMGFMGIQATIRSKTASINAGSIILQNSPVGILK